MTGKEMCEKIATEIERRTGEKVDPKALWEMSPSGELFPVFHIYAFLFPTDELTTSLFPTSEID